MQLLAIFELAKSTLKSRAIANLIKDVTGEKETADLTIAGYIAPTKDNVKFVEGIEGGLTPVTSITAGDFKLIAGTDLATGFGAESE